MTQTTTYKPTFLQKLLGKNYKWWFFIKYNITVAQASFYATSIAQVAVFVNSFVTVYVWSATTASSEIVTYLVVGSLYRNLLQTFWNERIGSDIILGKITNLLLVPQGYLQYHFCANLGQRIVRNLSLVLTSLTVVLCFLNLIKFNFNGNLIWLILLLPIGFSLNFFLNAGVGFLAFFLRDRRDFTSTANSILTVLGILSGSIIPLDRLPYNLLSIAQFLPTAWLLHHPMQIYLGKYNLEQTVFVFLGGIFWCIVLYFLAKLVFKMGLKKNESVGL